jgi:hypothetical protein
MSSVTLNVAGGGLGEGGRLLAVPVQAQFLEDFANAKQKNPEGVKGVVVFHTSQPPTGLRAPLGPLPKRLLKGDPQTHLVTQKLADAVHKLGSIGIPIYTIYNESHGNKDPGLPVAEESIAQKPQKVSEEDWRDFRANVEKYNIHEIPVPEVNTNDIGFTAFFTDGTKKHGITLVSGVQVQNCDTEGAKNAKWTFASGDLANAEYPQIQQRVQGSLNMLVGKYTLPENVLSSLNLTTDISSNPTSAFPAFNFIQQYMPRMPECAVM